MIRLSRPKIVLALIINSTYSFQRELWFNNSVNEVFVFYSVTTKNNNWRQFESPQRLKVNEWNHVGITYKKPTLKFVIDEKVGIILLGLIFVWEIFYLFWGSLHYFIWCVESIPNIDHNTKISLSENTYIKSSSFEPSYPFLRETCKKKPRFYSIIQTGTTILGQKHEFISLIHRQSIGE